jgi:hypothetical protein
VVGLLLLYRFTRVCAIQVVTMMMVMVMKVMMTEENGVDGVVGSEMGD